MTTDDTDNATQSFKSIDKVVVFYKDKSFQEIKE
jgi:hypothetical protein